MGLLPCITLFFVFYLLHQLTHTKADLFVNYISMKYDATTLHSLKQVLRGHDFWKKAPS